MKRKNLFYYNSKILKVSQLAAIAVYDFIGKKDEISADRAAVESMREELNKVDFNGTVVIGEGERDKAPMLYIGENVGNNKVKNLILLLIQLKEQILWLKIYQIQ